MRLSSSDKLIASVENDAKADLPEYKNLADVNLKDKLTDEISIKNEEASFGKTSLSGTNNFYYFFARFALCY